MSFVKSRVGSRGGGHRELRRRVRRLPEATPAIGAAVAPVSCDFRPRNCGAAANTLRGTGQVRDDPGLSRLSNTFYLQRDRSTTNAERAADCKMARVGSAFG